MDSLNVDISENVCFPNEYLFFFGSKNAIKAIVRRIKNY